jgi:hypothetical protein
VNGSRDTFSSLWGDPAAAEALYPAEAGFARIVRRAQRPAEPDGRAVRGVDRTELARHISEALRVGDEPRAHELISAGARLFWR